MRFIPWCGTKSNSRFGIES